MIKICRMPKMTHFLYFILLMNTVVCIYGRKFRNNNILIAWHKMFKKMKIKFIYLILKNSDKLF